MPNFINDHDTPVTWFVDALAQAGRDVLVPLMPKFDDADAKSLGIKSLNTEAVNAGLWIVRNTAWTSDFFRTYASRCYGADAPLLLQGENKMHGGEGLHEQYCLFKMMYGDRRDARTFVPHSL